MLWAISARFMAATKPVTCNWFVRLPCPDAAGMGWSCDGLPLKFNPTFWTTLCSNTTFSLLHIRAHVCCIWTRVHLKAVELFQHFIHANM
eukprot:m.244218 g.244218  ORF g.244218 m.244218 type:complete len:90 (+) comp17464_c0_seq1:4037-4306(+)